MLLIFTDLRLGFNQRLPQTRRSIQLWNPNGYRPLLTHAWVAMDLQFSIIQTFCCKLCNAVWDHSVAIPFLQLNDNRNCDSISLQGALTKAIYAANVCKPMNNCGLVVVSSFNICTDLSSSNNSRSKWQYNKPAARLTLDCEIVMSVLCFNTCFSHPFIFSVSCITGICV